MLYNTIKMNDTNGQKKQGQVATCPYIIVFSYLFLKKDPDYRK